MKFKLKCKYKGYDDSTAWLENYERVIKDNKVEQWCKDTIKSFNATLRPHEKERVYVGFVVVESSNDELHEWEKDITRMSVCNHLGHYDGMYCTKCGITGKRFGLAPHIKIDSKYKKKAFQKCNTAKIETGRF